MVATWTMEINSSCRRISSLLAARAVTSLRDVHGRTALDIAKTEFPAYLEEREVNCSATQWEESVNGSRWTEGAHWMVHYAVGLAVAAAPSAQCPKLSRGTGPFPQVQPLYSVSHSTLQQAHRLLLDLPGAASCASQTVPAASASDSSAAHASLPSPCQLNEKVMEKMFGRECA